MVEMGEEFRLLAQATQPCPSTDRGTTKSEALVVCVPGAHELLNDPLGVGPG